MPTPTDLPPLRLDRETMRRLGYRVIDHIVERWVSLPEQPIAVAPNKSELRARLDRPPPRGPRDPVGLVDTVVEQVLRHAAPTGHPRFFGFIPSPSSFVGAMAEALVSGFNPFGGNWLEAPGPHELERATIRWIRDAVGFPERAGGLFVSGGSTANLTALMVGRRRVLADETARARVYVSDQTHRSLDKALRVLGFGPQTAVVIPTDERFRMRTDALQQAIADDRARGQRPFAIVATLGTTNTGAIDPLVDVADVAAREDLWLHVDGAYGAAAMFASERRTVIDGLERADSFSMDPHKWLFVPYECACVMVRDQDHLLSTFRVRADYLDDVASDEPDFQDMGIQLTRSLKAIKVWMTFQVFGADAIAAAIDRTFEAAEAVQKQLEAMEGWEVATDASMAICAFRWAPVGVDETTLDARNRALVSALVETGEAMVTSTVLRGRRYLRMCTNNPRTTASDIERTLVTLDRLARRG